MIVAFMKKLYKKHSLMKNRNRLKNLKMKLAKSKNNNYRVRETIRKNRSR